MIFSMKNNFFLQLFISASLLLGSCQVLEASDLHAILTTDLNAYKIERAIKKDLDRMQKEIKSIVKFTGLKLKEKLFIGKKTDPQELIDYLRDLEVGQDDVILFYFSGHGFRMNQSINCPWPILAFEKSGVGIQFEEIASFLKAKNARLTLIFADCCNHASNFKFPKKIIDENDELFQKSVKIRLKERYCKLFLEPSGLLVVSSAQAGEYSYTSNIEGSLYTIALTNGLKEILKGSLQQISWKNLIEITKNNLEKVTTEAKISQHPEVHNKIIEN